MDRFNANQKLGEPAPLGTGFYFDVSMDQTGLSLMADSSNQRIPEFKGVELHNGALLLKI